MEIEKQSRTLFLKYALPCAGTLVKRGKVSQKTIDTIRDSVIKNKPAPEGAEKIFAVALAACTVIAKNQKKEIIDDEVIRDYFLFTHDDVIEHRYEEMRDFDPNACRIKPGIVNVVKDKISLVTVDGEQHSYQNDFVPDVQIGNMVVVHWDYIVEKISIETAHKIKKIKKKLPIVV